MFPSPAQTTEDRSGSPPLPAAGNDAGVSVDVVSAPTLNFAMEQNGVPLVPLVRVRCHGRGLADATLVLRLEPGLGAPLRLPLGPIPLGEERARGPIDYRLPPGRLRSVVEAERARLVWELLDAGTPVASGGADVEVLAFHQWPGIRAPSELLAAFVTPADPAIPPILARVRAKLAATTGDGALDGYQRRSPTRIRAMAAALVEAVAELGLGYCGAPPSFERTGQKIRLPGQLLAEGHGCCLDVSVLIAACFEAMGLRPLLVVLKDHAFPGVWLVDDRFPEGVVEDAARLRNLVALGHILVFDSSALVSLEAPTLEAVEAVTRRTWLEAGDAAPELEFALDVAVARGERRVRPLPLRVEVPEAGSAPGEGAPPPTETSPAAASPTAAPPPAAGATTAAAAPEKPPEPEGPSPVPPEVARRFFRWQERLLDLTLRNPLLSARHRGAGSLPIDVQDLGRFEDLLAGGQTFEILPEPDPDPRDTRDETLVRARGLDAQTRKSRREDLERGVLHAPLYMSDLFFRAAKLSRESRIDLEEGGASTLFAALGLLRWYETGGTERFAPLLLVPVTLLWDPGKKRIRLRRLPEDPLPNLTLVEKMALDHSIDLSGLALVPEDGEGLNVAGALAAVRAAIRHQPGWEVLEEAHLGRFSFTKFLMWKDLRDNAAVLLENPVVRHIASGKGGRFGAEVSSPAPADLDGAVAPDRLPCVLDADSTQLAAVTAALAGKSFVLQGPPGTGKSQTIANLIAASIAAGKTVLFVSEKMAALEVVYRRLRQVGLGDFCLELHSHKASKKDVLASLAASFERARNGTPTDWAERCRELAETRARLNAYARALHLPRPLGRTFYEAEARLLELGEGPEVRVDLERLPSLTGERYRELARAVAELAEAGRAIEPAPAHRWRVAGRAEWSAGAEEAIRDALEDLAGAVARVEATAAELSRLAGEGLPEATAAREERTRRIVAAAETAGEAFRNLAEARAEGPVPGPAAAVAEEWPAIAARGREWLADERADRERRDILATRWNEGLYTLDLDALGPRFCKWAGAFFLLAFLFLFFARRAMKGAARDRRLPANRRIADDLAVARTVRDARAGLDGRREELRRQLAGAWSDDLDALEALLSRGDRVHAATLALRSAAAELSCLGTPGMPERVAPAARAAAEALRQLGEVEGRLRELLAPVEGWPAPTDPGHRAFLEDLAPSLRSAMGELRPWCFYRRAAARVAELEPGLSCLGEAHLRAEVPAAELETAFERSLLRRWVGAVRDAEPSLREFDGRIHHRLVERFVSLDRLHLELSRRQVVGAVESRLPEGFAVNGEPGLLRRELAKKARHLPVRKLLAGLPNLLPRLKPCLLMSPLSVAQYLPADGRRFDLVVFDEASQIGTHDAIGAIARGNQVIVVGDSKQLPPTTFFSRNVDDDEEPCDDNDVVELESVLEEAVAAGLPQETLGWHYRSRHEALIDFSNRHYYDEKLHVFPAARRVVEELGVKWHPVPDGVYLGGESRTNPVEARRLVDHLVERLGRYAPGERSFGVVTFGAAQQTLIEDLLDEARATHPALEPHFTGAEPVFVKNLENVQGDERDEMYFSVGYARDAGGRLRMHFGPLSNAGGERRLNVAVTRARCQLHVFSTLTHDQIDLSRTTSLGARHLRDFLEYAARHGGAEEAAAAARTYPSRFEEEIARAVEALGYRVRTRVGCGAYRVDVAVEHPDHPGVFVLGIECDGPAYRSGATARDRDRLRGQVLASLGWRLHRIWSTDWWFSAAAEKERLKQAIEAARRSPPADTAPAPKPLPVPPPKRETPSFEVRIARAMAPAEAGAAAAGAAEAPGAAPGRPPVPPGPRAPAPAAPASVLEPYVFVELPPNSGTPQSFYWRSSDATLRRLLVALVDGEGPIHVDHLCRRVMEPYGLKAVTARLRYRVQQLLEPLADARMLALVGDFAWPAGIRPDDYRGCRGPAADGRERPLVEIATEELANAAARVLSASFSLEEDELLRETARLFGIHRVGPKVASTLGPAVDLLVARGVAAREDGRVHWKG